MRSCSRPPSVEHARPLLGTLVAIRVCDPPEEQAHRAIDAAFAEIAATQETISFHQPDSDVSRLNREAYCRPVRTSPHTRLVLRLAQSIAAETEGVFDVTTAAQLVERGLLPKPESFFAPDPRASWRDIVFGPGGPCASAGRSGSISAASPKAMPSIARSFGWRGMA